MYIKLQTNSKPASSWGAECDLGEDCTYQIHPKDYLDKGSSSLPCFVNNDSREKNTFPVTVWYYSETEVGSIAISDDDDTHHQLIKDNSSEEEMRRALVWLNNLAYIEPEEVLGRFEQLGWKYC